MDAKTAQFVDILGQNIPIDGNIITNLYSGKDASGQISVNPNAKQTELLICLMVANFVRIPQTLTLLILSYVSSMDNDEAGNGFCQRTCPVN